MIHVAILRKSWKLAQKILAGEKTVESRWYKNRSKPWDQIAAGDTVYFKDSGEPVTIQATVSQVLQFADLTPTKIKEIVEKYGDGIGLIPSSVEKYLARFREKRYCILVFLKDVEKVEPFEIDKTGFGLMTAWLVVDDIEKIKRRG